MDAMLTHHGLHTAIELLSLLVLIAIWRAVR